VHVLQKEDNDWVKKVRGMKWRVPDQEVDQRGLGEVVQTNCQVCKLNREDAMDHSRWKKHMG